MVVTDKSKCCLGMAKPVFRRVTIRCGLACGVTGTARGGRCRDGGDRCGASEWGAGVNPEEGLLPDEVVGRDPGVRAAARGMQLVGVRGLHGDAWVAGPAGLGGGDAIGWRGGCGGEWAG